jgi:hypothetical protein
MLAAKEKHRFPPIESSLQKLVKDLCEMLYALLVCEIEHKGNYVTAHSLLRDKLISLKNL